MSWFKVDRQLFESKLWLKEPFTWGQAWVDLFGNANHKESSFFIRGNEIKLKRGQLGWSELTMAKRWRWSRMKVRRYLKWLESEQQIVQQKMYKLTTIIDIINYDRFQCETTDDTTERQQKDNRRDTYKNEKNEKNNTNKEKKLKKEIPVKTYTKENLTLEQVAEKLVTVFEKAMGTTAKFPKDNLNNLAYWLEVYTDPNQIVQAITQIPYDDYWKNGGMTPTLLFRRKNPKGEPVDYIGQLLNSRKEKYASSR